ncbi:MAG: hypothetical protein K8W52_22885 [Deltaproteobacteria bacterium]|nr:hypothetical protein [Deltaproteobacteria bacterium]
MVPRVLPLVCLMACAPPSVVVTVEARPTVAPLDQLDVRVQDMQGVVTTKTFPLTDVRLPATFVVDTEGRDGSITISATGIDVIGLDERSVPVANGAVDADAGVQDAVTLVLEPADQPINSTIRGDQWPVDALHGAVAGAALAAGEDGGVIAVFESPRELRARRLDKAGRPAMNGTTRTELDFPIGSDALFLIGRPVISAGPDGAYLAAWEQPYTAADGVSSSQVWLAGLDATGAARSPQVLYRSAQVARLRPRLTPVAGGWLAVWQEPADPLDDYGGEIRLARIDATTVTPGAPTVVAAGGIGHQGAQVAVSGDEVLVVWEDSTTASPQLWARRFDAALAPRGAAVAITTAPARVARLTGDASGYVLVYWDDTLLGDAHAWWLQRLEPAGAPVGAPVEIARTTRYSPDGDVEPTSLAIRADGVIAVVWADGDATTGDTDVFLRAFRRDGTPCGAAQRVNTTMGGAQGLASVAPFGADAFAVAWGDTSASIDDPDGSAIRGRIVYVACR